MDPKTLTGNEVKVMGSVESIEKKGHVNLEINKEFEQVLMKSWLCSSWMAYSESKLIQEFKELGFSNFLISEISKRCFVITLEGAGKLEDFNKDLFDHWFVEMKKINFGELIEGRRVQLECRIVAKLHIISYHIKIIYFIYNNFK